MLPGCSIGLLPRKGHCQQQCPIFLCEMFLPVVSLFQATGHSMCSQCMVDISFCFSDHCLSNLSPQHGFSGLPLSQQWSAHHPTVFTGQKVWVRSPSPSEIWSPKPLSPRAFCSGEMKSPSWTQSQICRGKGCSGPTSANHAAWSKEARGTIIYRKSFLACICTFIHGGFHSFFCIYRSPGLGILV